jgi:hypothetical protein
MAKPSLQAQMLEELRAIRDLLLPKSEVSILPRTFDFLMAEDTASARDAFKRARSFYLLDYDETNPGVANAVLVEGVELDPVSIEQMKRAPDGRRRPVLRVVSLTDLDRKKEDFPKTAGVPHFWLAGWIKSVFADIEHELSLGYDGVCLADADAYLDLELVLDSEDLPWRMANLVQQAASFARAVKPNAIVTLYDAEGLLSFDGVAECLDGAFKEDLFYGTLEDNAPNPPDSVAWSVSQLKRVKGPVFVIENLEDSATLTKARHKAEAQGFILHG